MASEKSRQRCMDHGKHMEDSCCNIQREMDCFAGFGATFYAADGKDFSDCPIPFACVIFCVSLAAHLIQKNKTYLNWGYIDDGDIGSSICFSRKKITK